MAEFEIIVPPEVTVEFKGKEVVVKGKLGELKRSFDLEYEVKKEDGKIILSKENARRKEKAILGTIAAHIRNMIKGVTEGYTYKLKAVYKHFPINLSVEGNQVVIKNFYGEKKPRYAKILPGAEVQIKGEIIEVKGINKEIVGQTAANIEQATRVRGRDIRVFQDGIFIIKKG